MIQPGRKYEATDSYRYGFNGKEKSFEINGDNYDFGARIYDGRVGKWLSVDPMSEKYPALSPYNFVANNPVLFGDVNGKDFILYFSTTDEAWRIFTSIIENKFKGLVLLTKSEISRKGERIFSLPEGGGDMWLKVDWSINEKKLEEMAKASLKENASPDEIAKKKNEILNELVTSFSYQRLDKIIHGDVDVLYNISTDENMGNFGSAAELGPRFIQEQGINLTDMQAFGKQELLTPFNMMLHEIMEGFYIHQIRQSPSSNLNSDLKVTEYREYAYGHWNALLDQAKDAGLDFMYSEMGILGSSSENATIDVITFSRIKSGKDKGKYLRKIYTIRTKDGKISSIEAGNLSQTSVTKAAYEKEKSAAKNSLKKETKKNPKP